MSNEGGCEVALVTGAGSAQGIGFAVARVLAVRGARVVITSTTDRIHERAAELRALGADARGVVVADLCDESAARRLVDEALEVGGCIDICVNNAGMVQTGGILNDALLEDYDAAMWNDALRRNLTTCYHVTRAALPVMRCAVTGGS